jgi:hypothetical protein
MQLLLLMKITWQHITDIDGNFEFKLPEGEYEIQVYSDSKSKDGTVEI